MIKTSIILFVLFYLVTAHSQQTIDKLNSNQLKLPKETISKALSVDANGQVKSSATSDVELGYLSGASSNVQDQIDDKANDADAVHLTGDESISGVKTLTGKLVTSSTINASIPCPVMTELQRDAITLPVVGDCVFNSNTSLSNIYDGAIWKAMGGSGGGISLWVTNTGYVIDDVVIESNNIYICLAVHTSGTFAIDLAALKWLRLSTDVTGATGVLSLANGGTNSNITHIAGAVVITDADSMELTAGTSGQILQSNGTSTPSFVNKSISAKAQNDSSVGIEELQVPNNQLTETIAGKYLNETGNKNILVNPSFEHSTFSTSWTNSAGTFTQELTSVIDGKASAKLVLSAQTMSLTQSSSLYATQFADGVQGLAMVRIKSDVAVKVCSIQAGTVSTSNCVTTSTDSKWGLYKVPFILGGTSNGISISTNGTLVTGTVIVDDAFVGAINLESQNGACITSDCTTTFSAFVSSAGVVSGENVDFINGNAVITSTDVFTITFNTGVFTVAPNFGYKMFNEYGTGTITIINNNATITASTAAIDFLSVSGTGATNIALTSGFWVTFTKSGADFTQAEAKKTGNVFTTQCGADCVDTFSFKGSSAGVVSDENQNIINGNSVVSDTSVFTYTFNTGIFTVAPNCTVTGEQATTGTPLPKILSVSSTTLVIRTYSSTTPTLTPYSHQVSCQKQGADFVATRNIVGSFNEVMTSPGISKPKVCHYAFGGAAATLAAPTVCSTGTCVEAYDSCNAITPPSFSSTGIYAAMTIASGTFANNSLIQCDCRAWDTVIAAKYCAPYFTTGQDSWKTNASGGYVLNSASFTTAGTVVNSYFQYTCTGQAP